MRLLKLFIYFFIFQILVNCGKETPKEETSGTTTTGGPSDTRKKLQATISQAISISQEDENNLKAAEKLDEEYDNLKTDKEFSDFDVKAKALIQKIQKPDDISIIRNGLSYTFNKLKVEITKCDAIREDILEQNLKILDEAKSWYEKNKDFNLIENVSELKNLLQQANIHLTNLKSIRKIEKKSIPAKKTILEKINIEFLTLKNQILRVQKLQDISDEDKKTFDEIEDWDKKHNDPKNYNLKTLEELKALLDYIEKSVLKLEAIQTIKSQPGSTKDIVSNIIITRTAIDSYIERIDKIKNKISKDDLKLFENAKKFNDGKLKNLNDKDESILKKIYDEAQEYLTKLKKIYSIPQQKPAEVAIVDQNDDQNKTTKQDQDSNDETNQTKIIVQKPFIKDENKPITTESTTTTISKDQNFSDEPKQNEPEHQDIIHPKSKKDDANVESDTKSQGTFNPFVTPKNPFKINFNNFNESLDIKAATKSFEELGLYTKFTSYSIKKEDVRYIWPIFLFFVLLQKKIKNEIYTDRKYIKMFFKDHFITDWSSTKDKIEIQKEQARICDAIILRNSYSSYYYHSCTYDELKQILESKDKELKIRPPKERRDLIPPGAFVKAGEPEKDGDYVLGFDKDLEFYALPLHYSGGVVGFSKNIPLGAYLKEIIIPENADQQIISGIKTILKDNGFEKVEVKLRSSLEARKYITKSETSSFIRKIYPVPIWWYLSAVQKNEKGELITYTDAELKDIPNNFKDLYTAEEFKF